MNRRILLFALVLPATARAHSSKLGNIAIGHSWALPSQQAEGHVFFPLINNGTAPDELIAARSEICNLIELRKDDQYGEAALKSIVLEPGMPVAMRPSARHLRLVGLNKPLNQGDSFKIVLEFVNAGEIEIEVIVEPSASD